MKGASSYWLLQWPFTGSPYSDADDFSVGGIVVVIGNIRTNS